MGFFKDLRNDISQAVNELLPDDDFFSVSDDISSEMDIMDEGEFSFSQEVSDDAEMKAILAELESMEVNLSDDEEESEAEVVDENLEVDILSIINNFDVEEEKVAENSVEVQNVEKLEQVVNDSVTESERTSVEDKDDAAELLEVLAALNAASTQQIEETATEIVTEEAETVAETVTEEVETVAETVTEEVEAIAETVTEEVEAIAETVTEEAEAVAETVTEEAEAVAETVTEEAEAVEEIVTEEAEAIEEIVTEEAEAVAETVTEETEAVVETPTELFKENEISEQESFVEELSEGEEEELAEAIVSVIKDEIPKEVLEELEMTENMELIKDASQENEEIDAMAALREIELMETELMGSEESASESDTLQEQKHAELPAEMMRAMESIYNADTEEQVVENIVEKEKEEKNMDSVLASAEVKNETTVITKGTVITGSISSDGSLEINGTITGDVECLGTLVINGNVSGHLKAAEVVVSTPKLQGGIESKGDVKVSVGTIVLGDIVAKSATISGAVKGEIDVQGPVVVDSTAIVKGNITAKSVQINNGAVVDGYCKLSYADVDIENFFEA